MIPTHVTEARERSDYKAFVGRAGEYDFMGASQFALLFTLGLRAHHRLLDFGCGSLRAGRLLIPYLDPGNYYGLEPNEWLVRAAIREQVGDDLVRAKAPTFVHRSDFDAAAAGEQFDFLLANSVFSHAGPQPVRNALRGFRTALSERGLAVVTFVEGSRDHDGADWVYPGVVEYRPATIAEFAAEAGLAIERIPWFHPKQTWFLLARDRARLPHKDDLTLLGGRTLEPLYSADP